jgi:hypothetical protein
MFRISDTRPKESPLKRFMGLIPDIRPREDAFKAKPRQVRDYPKWSKAILQHLLESGKDHTTVAATVKADGHSVIFECQGGDSYSVYTRTDNKTSRFSGSDARRFVTQLACDLRVRLACELRALYDGKEMGFLEVLSMLRIFENNKRDNVGKFQLQLYAFGVVSINPGGHDMSARGCSELPREVLKDLLENLVGPDRGLISVVQSTQYRVRLYDTASRTQDLEYLTADGRQTVARGPKEFFDFLIKKADASSIEGFVLQADPAIFKGPPFVVQDNNRVTKQADVKVKREFFVELLACRVLEYKGKTPKSHVYVYGRDKNNNIVYAGEQTGHERLEAILPKAGHAFTFKNKQEKEALYQLSEQQVLQRQAFITQIASPCTNMSKTRFCPIGLKNCGLGKRDFNPNKLSVLQHVAEGNPHFCSTREASNRFAAAIGRGDKKPVQIRKRKTLGGSPPPEGKRSAVAAPASMGFEDFMDELGEQFTPAPRPPREPTPEPVIDLEEPTPVVEEPTPVVEKPTPVVKEPAPVVEEPLAVKHRVLFVDKPAPMTTKLFQNQFAAKGWTLTYAPDPSVTLIVATADQINRPALCTELQGKCPDARFTTLQGLKAELAA